MAHPGRLEMGTGRYSDNRCSGNVFTSPTLLLPAGNSLLQHPTNHISLVLDLDRVSRGKPIEYSAEICCLEYAFLPTTL